MTADRNVIKADGSDLSYVSVEVVDEKGLVVPVADNTIQFSITGAGEIAAVGNADPTDVSSFQKPERRAFRGKCLVIIRSARRSGTISLKATSNGLTEGQVTIASLP